MSDRCEPPPELRGVDGWHWVTVNANEHLARWSDFTRSQLGRFAWRLDGILASSAENAGAVCWLHNARTGNFIEWRWTGTGWDRPGHLFVTLPEAMARVGWRFHSLATPEPKP
jgi:hypothetical protein